MGTATAEPATRVPDMVTSRPVIFGGLKVKEGKTRTYRSVQLIVDGTVRTYDLAQDFDGELPTPGQLVEVAFLSYCAVVDAISRDEKRYSRRVESLAVLQMKAAKA